MDNGLSRYSLDRGIDSISRTSLPEVPLPDAALLPPASQVGRPELDRLLLRPNLQDYLIEQLQPDIADRQLLTPQRFEQTLHAAAQSLRDIAAAGNGPASRTAILSKAARMLSEEVNLRELLNMYRSTLFQG
jgi:type III secretion protein X